MRFVAALVLSVMFTICGLVALALILALTAHARDLDGRFAASPLADWYAKQQNIVGEVCCTDADGHPVSDWGRGPAGYWVVYDGKRHEVPATAMVKGSHPQGLAVVWIYPIGTDTVRCFLPGMEG